MCESESNVSEEWWTDDQKDLVEDPSRHWKKEAFTISPGYWISINSGRMLRKLGKNDSLPDGAILDANAWDHEHCALCWQKISKYPGDQQEGYFDGEDWLCIDCYNKYIMPPESVCSPGA